VHTLWIFLFASLAFFWLVQSILLAHGMPQLPYLADAAPLPDAECPKVSIIFSARDEAEKLPRALATMLALDYPNYKIVAVDDRSSDATPQILDEAARRDRRLKVVHIASLPPGWLGKPQGLQRGFEASSGEWLVFTDGDVRFAPDVLRRALALARQRGWDHLTLLGWLDLEGFWEKAVMTYFGVGFTVRFQPWRVSNPRSKAFMGVGSFQLVRREAYEKSGMHKKLAMEVIDDMKLGKIIKQAGAHSGVGVGAEYVTLRWHAGIGNIIHGVEKNFFAGANFSLPIVIAQIAGILAMSVLPFLGVLFFDGWARILAGAAVLLIVTIHGAAAYSVKVSPLYGLVHPVGALLFCYMILRSTVVTLWHGGITWRGTFYPLEELRRGIV
jgi:glycosyltransferase involved in cell wall biosynthesis